MRPPSLPPPLPDVALEPAPVAPEAAGVAAPVVLAGTCAGAAVLLLAGGAGAGAAVLPLAGGAGAGADLAADAAPFAGGTGAASCAALAAPAASITPTTVWIGTVFPSATLISFRIPADGDGISASTLSVEISNSGSSRSTLSPGFFSHLVMVPSKILSPICGITMSTAMSDLL